MTLATSALNARAATLPAGELITFVQQALPGLIDGEYQLTIRQHVEDATKASVSDVPYAKPYTFAVLGDRFGLADPSGTVYATFPENAASGIFNAVLPHVVFTAPKLPWARTPLVARTLPAVGTDAAGDVPSWLAVLLLDPNDTPPGSTALGAADATIGDLFPASAVPGSTLGTRLSYFAGASDASSLEPGQTVATPIRILDLPLALFQALAPTLTDLALLAHVRTVSFENKPTMAGISDVGEPAGSFSIVVGNRLPANDITSTAYLVSLEGLAKLLPTDPPSTTLPAPDQAIRLAVLHSWSFTATGSSAAFVDTLLGLNAPATSAAAAPPSSLCLPLKTSDAATNTALQLGYVPLNHDLRDGGKTVSWYRGPLAPVTVPRGRVSVPIASADRALILDPGSGLLDTSYAAAWTIGRLLAVQNKAYSVALYHWKRGLTRQAIDAAEEQVLDAAAVPSAALKARPSLVAGLRPALTHAQSAPLADALHRSLLLKLAKEALPL